jgi:tetratricopeptide (TPR) repeat protein
VLALTLTATATAQPIGGPVGDGPIEQQTRWRLLTSSAVGADLKLKDDQKAKLKAIPDAVRAKHQAKADDLKKKIDANVAARQKMVAELDKATQEAIAAVLKPAQVTRLKQIHVQSLGHGAFTLPAVQAALKLNEQQVATVRKFGPEFQEAFQKALGEAAKEAGGDMAKYQRLATAKYEDLSREYLGRALLLLGAEQRKTWEGLTGPAVKLPPLDAPLQPSPLLNVRLLLLDEPPGPAYDDPADLLDHPGLAKALGLGADEAAKVAALPGQLAKRFEAAAQKAQEDGMGLQVDRFALEVQMGEEARGRAMKDVLSPEQAKRLTEIELQAKGLWAFGEPEVMKALKLTPEQSAAVEVAGDRVAHQAQEVSGLGLEPAKWQAEVGKRIGPPMRDGLTAVLAKLSDEQKKAWRDLAGEPFDFGKATEFVPYVDVVMSAPASPAMRSTLRGAGLAGQKRYAEARAEFEEGARLGPRNTESLNSLAYFLATCPEDKQRDGKRALALAQQVNEMSGGKDPNYLDTLAAAYAEVGQFDDAIKAQTKALELAPPVLRGQLEERLKLFRAKKPVRQ